ncbi:hypothetical protein SUGI_0947430 [Cryptomeria japonica]|nr:hypothetical protein SUGI_0947430 [Cryptomeria japonica]
MAHGNLKRLLILLIFTHRWQVDTLNWIPEYACRLESDEQSGEEVAGQDDEWILAVCGVRDHQSSVLRIEGLMHGPKRTRLMTRFMSLGKWRRCSFNSRPSMGCAIISLRRYRSWHENEETPPEGYLAVYVGAERKRFVIRTEHINHPLFRMLLDQAENEYGFQSFGPLTLPCEVSLFRKILWALNDPASGNAAAVASTDLLTISAM